MTAALEKSRANLRTLIEAVAAERPEVPQEDVALLTDQKLDLLVQKDLTTRGVLVRTTYAELVEVGVTPGAAKVLKLLFPVPAEGAGSVGGGGGLGPAADELIERTIKRLRAHEEEVSVSSFGQSHWGHLAKAAGLRLERPKQLTISSSGNITAPPFHWSAEPEPQQAVRYMPHLKNILPISTRTSSQLVWLEGGNKNKSLLDVFDMEDTLYYKKIKGNTDAAIITRDSLDINLPSTGLCILFELKKPENMTAKETYQAICQAVLSTVLSPYFKPVVVLTDLQDHWQLHWVHESKVMSGTCASRSDALAIIQACVTQAEHLASAPPGTCPAQSSTGQLPDELANRQPRLAASDAAPVDEGDSGLAQLSGDLPDAELRAAHAFVLLQRLSHLPVFSKMPPPSMMYS